MGEGHDLVHSTRYFNERESNTAKGSQEIEKLRGQIGNDEPSQKL